MNSDANLVGNTANSRQSSILLIYNEEDVDHFDTLLLDSNLDSQLDGSGTQVKKEPELSVDAISLLDNDDVDDQEDSS